MTKSIRILLTAAAILIAPNLPQASAQALAEPAGSEWRHYASDLHSTKYSPLDQINAGNMKQLQIAWRWKSNNFGPRLEGNMETTPLMIGGVLYFNAGSRRVFIAADAATGETLR